MMCGKSEVIIVILKSSFLPKEPKRRISSGYYRDDKSSNICWARGPVRRRLWKSTLVNKERDLVMMVQKGGPRRNASSVKQNRGQKERFAIKNNVLGNSTVKAKY